MTDREFRAKLAEARIRVGQYDEVEGHKDRALATILATLEAGLKNPTTDAVFDAYVMLEQSEDKN